MSLIQWCPSLKDAVTTLALERDRQAARRKAIEVNWGDTIVPRVQPFKVLGGEIHHFVYDASRPGGESVGHVAEIVSGTRKGKWTAMLWGSHVSIRDTLAAGVQDIVDVIAKELRPPYQLGDAASGVADDEEKEERPYDAVPCPLFDTPVAPR